jgi:hypothetical protein
MSVINVFITTDQAMKIQRGVVVGLYSFFNFGIRCGGWSKPRSGRFTPQERDPVPIV